MKILSTLLLPIVLLIACEANVQKSQEKTMTGIVDSIILGKDGYVAVMNGLQGESFNAVISIVNLGGPANYKKLTPKDKAILTGEYFILENEGRLIVSKIDAVIPSSPLITENSFMQLSLGDNITDHGDNLTKGILKDGEGSFEVYWINDDVHKNLGYCLLHSKEDPRIEQIYITSPIAKTESDLRIGTTFSQLSKIHPDIEVHGSEIEGRTYAYANNGISYRLDVANFSYELDRKAIPETAKITEIMIR